MKKMNIFKILMTLTLALFVTGAFAQSITLTVTNSDGTAANAVVVSTITDGVTTVLYTDGTGTDLDAPENGVISFNPGAVGNYNYFLSVGGQSNTFSIAYDNATDYTANVTLNANFTETIQDYVAGYTNDKVTINKPMPLWVYPSPVHNPAWAAPAAADESEIQIADNGNLVSTFAWTYGTDGTAAAFEAPGTATDNYVEITWSSVGTKTITVTETAGTAYGGCPGDAKTFFTEVINIPYIEFTNTETAEDPDQLYTFNHDNNGGTAGIDIHVIMAECETAGTAINPTISNGDNTSEEYPYYIAMNYTVHNATISGNDITLGAAETMPAAVDVQEGGSTVSSTNPLILDGTVKLFNGSNNYTLLAAPTAFPIVNDDITVYRFDMATVGYNAGISRKSDYVAMRDNGGTAANWNDANYSWYNDDNGGTNELEAWIVILPAPKTGPIYHIPNTWGL